MKNDFMLCDRDGCNNKFAHDGLCRKHYDEFILDRNNEENRIKYGYITKPVKIFFQQLGHEKNVQPILSFSNNIFEVTGVVERALVRRGFSPARFRIVWNPEGDNVNYIVNHTTQTTVPLAVFKVMDITPNKAVA